MSARKTIKTFPRDFPTFFAVSSRGVLRIGSERDLLSLMIAYLPHVTNFAERLKAHSLSAGA